MKIPANDNHEPNPNVIYIWVIPNQPALGELTNTVQTMPKEYIVTMNKGRFVYVRALNMQTEILLREMFWPRRNIVGHLRYDDLVNFQSKFS